VTDPQPLTGDELAAIKARAEAATTDREVWAVLYDDVPRLVTEIERLRAQVDHLITALESVGASEAPQLLKDIEALMANP
jgi:phage host-nuclease inhibitor protein Gam